MKLKSWLISSYIIVMLIPIFSGALLYKWIESYNNDIELNTYINNISIFDKYDKKLQNFNLYINPTKNQNILDKNDKNTIEIELYDKDGIEIYSSTDSSVVLTKPRDQLYTGLYEVQHGYRADTIKKPVFKNNDLVGFYEIKAVRTEWIEGINERAIIAVALFVLVLMLVLYVVTKLINKKVNKPLSMLINVMGKYASGENVSIEHKTNDEIGELIKHFNNMRFELEKERKSKEYMTAAISHDLKTPLTSIRAYTEIISKDKNIQNNDKTRYTSIILSKCDYMTQMLDDLLMYTVLASQYKMDFVDVEGQELFEMLFSDYEELCGKNEIIYKSEIDVNGSYKVDVKQMMRVMDNLVSNAIRHTEKGKTIYLGAFSCDINLPSWLGDECILQELDDFRRDGFIFIVKNEGKEISKEDIKKIFEPFYKVDNSRNKKSKSGTGLGLSVVKLIMDEHKGKIKVLSKNGNGTIIAGWIKKL